MDVFKISKDGVKLEERGARASHDQFVQLVDYERLENENKKLKFMIDEGLGWEDIQRDINTQ